jgi:hypothetical protein
LKNFLVCQKCDGKPKIEKIAHKDDKVGVKVRCPCGETGIFYVFTDDFMAWAATPEITAAMRYFNPKKSGKLVQESLW